MEGPDVWKENISFFSKYAKLGSLGRLGFKNEAAGKVRVFAMVDCFTQ